MFLVKFGFCFNTLLESTNVHVYAYKEYYMFTFVLVVLPKN